MCPHEYKEFLIERLCEAFMEAWDNRLPGGISFQLAYAVVGHNRHIVYDDRSALMYGTSDTINFKSTECPVDHGVELMYIWDTNNNLIGCVINVACYVA